MNSIVDWIGEDGDDTCYVADMLLDNDMPSTGCCIDISIGYGQLQAGIIMTDAAEWEVTTLGVKQESFAHGGFKGSVSGLLTKVSHDIDMMRDGYSATMQHDVDNFLDCIDMLLKSGTEGGGEKSDEVICRLRIRDPSGISQVIDRFAFSSCTVEPFERSFAENDSLGLINKIYTEIDPSQRIYTAMEVADLVRKSKHIVCLSGAGISVESGIPPFRSHGSHISNSDASAGTIWRDFDATRMGISSFNSDPQGAMYWWKMKHSLLPKVTDASPNPAHDFFFYLHDTGKLRNVITQNVDSLHIKSGVPADKVLELHGHMRGLICSDKMTPLNQIPYRSGDCTYSLSEEEALEVGYYASTPVPKCPNCLAPLRTETVMFGQPLPENIYQTATEIIAGCDLLFIIGTSLVVSPVNTLPTVAIRLGIPLVMINLDDTQFDDFSTAVIREPAGAFLSKVKNILQESPHCN